MITIIDYGAGNIRSVVNAVSKLGYPSEVTSAPERVLNARGVILQLAASSGARVRHFSATRIKKSLTGNGRAGKEQMQRAIQSTLGLPRIPEPPDVADAIAVALCCANEQNRVKI